MDYLEKQRALSRLSDRELVDRVMSFADPARLDYLMDERRTARCMAVPVAENASRKMDRGLSQKERSAIIMSFARHSTTQIPVSGMSLERGVNIVSGQVKLHTKKEGDMMNVYIGPSKVGYIHSRYLEAYAITSGMDIPALASVKNGKASCWIGQDLEAGAGIDSGIRPLAQGENPQKLQTTGPVEKKGEESMKFKEKRKSLLKMDDRSLVDRILAFPDREKLNRDEEGARRKYPSAEMALNARRCMEKDPEWKISDKQRFAMCDSFAKHSSDELKVAGIKFAKADPNLLVKEETSKDGVKTVYNMRFHLRPEPENEHDANAVAVYVDNVEGDRTKIGYVPAAYVAGHPIIMPMAVDGTLTDHSNGKFKTISYAMDMDTEALDKELQGIRPKDRFTYRMPFILNGNAEPGTAEYLNTQRDWTRQLNNELEYWGVNGEAESVSFEFPGGKAGSIIVESMTALNDEAMGVCGSYFRYSLESGISSDLKRDGYVKVAQTQAAVNTRERTYFSLQAQLDRKMEEDFTSAIGSIGDDGGQAL